MRLLSGALGVLLLLALLTWLLLRGIDTNAPAYAVTLRADGFIEKLYANETGHHVTKGEPLFRLYSPEMVRVQVDYRSAMATGSSARDREGALQRLKNVHEPDRALERDSVKGHQRLFTRFGLDVLEDLLVVINQIIALLVGRHGHGRHGLYSLS